MLNVEFNANSSKLNEDYPNITGVGNDFLNLHSRAAKGDSKDSFCHHIQLTIFIQN